MIYLDTSLIVKCYLREHGCTEVYTHDVAMRQAAPHFGLKGLDLLATHPPA